MNEQTPRLIGFVWQQGVPPGVMPRLTATVESRRYARGYTPRIVHPAWILDYSISYSGRYRVGNDRIWRERPGFEAHLYPPGTSYWEDYESDPKRLYHSTYISFLGGEIAGLPDLLKPLAYARIEDPRKILAEMLREIVSIGHRLGDDGFWKAQAVFYRLLDTLRNSLRVDNEARRLASDSPAPKTSPLPERVRGYLRERIREKVTHARLAHDLNMSVSTLAHRYRAEAGETLMTSLQKMRMSLSAELLRHGMRIKEVARECGFYDEFHFSKSFKSHHGVPPRAYVTSHRQEPSKTAVRRKK
jgi:AraC-like DNA-binding protein